MSSFSPSIDEIILSIKQSLDTLRVAVFEKTTAIGEFISRPNATGDIMDSANVLKEKALSLVAANGAASMQTENAVVQAKHFIIANKKQLLGIVSKLLGLTISATVSYFLFKWIMNAADPTQGDKKLAKAKSEYILKKLGLKPSNLNEYEQLIATNMILPQNIDVCWADIGGLDHLINDLRETVIYPLKNDTTKFTRSRLIQPPKGVLLFGPPGNAKTMIAKALAKESGANFINLQISTLFDKWYGESQKRTDAIFSLAQKIQPCIIFIDEIDSFLRLRNSVDHECTLMMKTQFMTLWDGLTNNQSNSRILIIGATNRPQDVDPAILRRMPALFNIGMPSEHQRKKILNVILERELIADDVDLDGIALRTDDFSGSDLKELCRCAAMNRFITNIKEGNQLNLNDATANACSNERALNEDLEAARLRKCDFDVAFEKLGVKKLTKKLTPIFDSDYE